MPMDTTIVVMEEGSTGTGFLMAVNELIFIKYYASFCIKRITYVCDNF